MTLDLCLLNDAPVYSEHDGNEVWIYPNRTAEDGSVSDIVVTVIDGHVEIERRPVRPIPFVPTPAPELIELSRKARALINGEAA